MPNGQLYVVIRSDDLKGQKSSSDTDLDDCTRAGRLPVLTAKCAQWHFSCDVVRKFEARQEWLAQICAGGVASTVDYSDWALRFWNAVYIGFWRLSWTSPN